MTKPDNNIENPATIKQKSDSKRSIWRLLGWLGAVVLVSPIACCEFVAQLNAHGVCVSQARRIPDEELIRPWAEAAVRNYPPPDKSFRRDEKGEWISALHDYGEPIPYRNVAELFALNPSCCTVQNFDPETGYTPDENQRRWGFGRGFVKIEYKLRYRTKDRLVRFQMHLDNYPVTNCGKYWNPYS